MQRERHCAQTSRTRAGQTETGADGSHADDPSAFTSASAGAGEAAGCYGRHNAALASSRGSQRRYGWQCWFESYWTEDAPSQCRVVTEFLAAGLGPDGVS